jgi:alpha-glucosidase
LLTTLRGTPFLYYGDEVGMLNGSNQGRDPWGDNVAFLSRDGCRTPMQWDGSKLVGFGESKPWIPIGPEPGKRNVEVQRDDPESLLTLYRNLLAIRKKRVSLRLGDYQTLESPHEDVLIYLRSIDGESTTVAINFGEEAVQLNRLGDPVITLGGYEPYDGLVFLGPGAVVIWDSTAYGLPHPLSSSS